MKFIYWWEDMNNNQNTLKKLAAEAALSYVKNDMIVGIGTGSTVNYFIDALAGIKGRLEGTVASSKASAARLKSHGIRVFELNVVGQLPLYVDGADEVNAHLQMIKGGGGALTSEKIIATVAEKFICIADQSKQVTVLGEFPVAIEVIPMARGYVARELVKLGASPVYREGFITDHGNIILDVFNLDLTNPVAMEQTLNNITGTVANGIFAARTADVLLLGTDAGVVTRSHAG